MRCNINTISCRSSYAIGNKKYVSGNLSSTSPKPLLKNLRQPKFPYKLIHLFRPNKNNLYICKYRNKLFDR